MRSFVHAVKSLSPRLGALLLVASIFSACNRDDVKVYRVAKEESPAPQTQEMPAGHPETAAAKPQLSWTLPAGWQEAGEGRMSLATFSITGGNGKQAQVMVTPLRGLAGKEVLIVNMWRQQVGQPELSADEVNQQLLPVEIGNAPGKMFEIAGKADGSDASARIVTAMQHRGDTSWFFKLAGDTDLVEAQKPAFVAFLKSVKITEAPATEVATSPAPATSESAPAVTSEWKIPADWKTVSPGPMQNAKFTVPEKNGANADVTVSIFPSVTGTALMNVNRWRGQIGLPQIDETELAKLVVQFDDKNPDAVLVDMTNNDRRLIGVSLPRGGQWYFYKLLGGVEAVAPQKEAFVAFAKAQP